MLSSIDLLNFKGLTSTVTLAPLTYIHGPNRSHKTTAIDALLVALLGYHPEVGKTNGAVMQFASAGTMSVAVSGSEAVTVSRRFTGGETVKAVVSPKGFTLDPRLAVALDSSLYFGKTETDRIALVTGLIETGTAKRAEIVAALKAVKIEPHTEAAEGVLAALLETLPEQREGQSAQAWLDVVAEWLKAKAKETGAQVKTLDATARGLTDISIVESMLSALASLADYDAAIKSHETGLAAARQRLGKLTAEHEAAAKNLARRMQIESELDELAANAVPVEERAQIETALAEARASLSTASPAATKARATLNTATATHAKLEAQAASESRELSQINIDLAKLAHLPALPTAEDEAAMVKVTMQAEDSLGGVEADRVRMEARMLEIARANGGHAGTIETETREIAKLREELAALETACACPTCRAAGKGWQDTARKLITGNIDAREKALNDATLALQQGQAEIRAREKDVAEFKKQADFFRTEIAGHKERAENWKRAAARTPLLERRTKMEATFATTRDALEFADHALTQAHVDAEAAGEVEQIARDNIAASEVEVQKWTGADARRASLTAELGRLNEAGGEGDEDAIAVLREEIATLEGQIAATRADRDKRKALEHDKQRIAAAQEAAATAKTEVDVIKAAAEEVRAIKVKLTAEAMQPVLDVANRVVAGLFVLAFEDGVVGRREDGRFIPHATFSGSEKRLTVAAITAGLAARAPFRLFILDEFDTIDEVNKPKILRNLARMVEDKALDQVLVVGLTKNSAAVEGWRVIAA